MAGVDPTPFFANWGYSQQELTNTSEFLPWNSNDHQGVFSVRLESGETVTWNGDRFLTDTAELGFETIHSVATQVRDHAANGEPILYHQRPPAQPPVTGVHVDFVEKRLQWWSLADEYGGLPTFDALWKGWTIESMGDEYEWQQELIGVPLRNWEHDVQECREWMQRQCSLRGRETPTMEIAGFLDDEAEADSAGLAPVPVVGFHGIEVLSLLSKLAEGEPLPPARFVNRWGEIRGGRD